MKEEIVIPSMGESIIEVIIGSILKKTGESVAIDEEIIELETDKVNQVLSASAAGVVQWSIKEGDTVQVGAVIGFIDSEGIIEPQQEEVIEKTITPIGHGERIMEFVQEIETPVEKSETVNQREKRRPLSKIRKIIAARLVDSLQTAAMLTTFNEVDMSAIIALRAKYKESFLKNKGVKLGFLSFFVKAVVCALKEFPALNSYIDGDEVVERQYYDIGIAVGTDKGLVVPVLSHCDKKNFADIERAIVDFAQKARSGHLGIGDLEGGGFTITNGGVYGSMLSTPILNPPQVGILGMHQIKKRAVVVDDEIKIRSIMYLALSYDHRLVDGKESVSFLKRVKEILEDPESLLFMEDHGEI